MTAEPAKGRGGDVKGPRQRESWISLHVMRLFVALVPPQRVLDEIEEAVAPLRSIEPGLRWVRGDLWHVTLSFLGEVEEGRLDRLVPRLAKAASRHVSLELSFAGAGSFPPGGARARVLWTGLYGDRRALARLADSVAAGAHRSGIGIEQRKAFSPHLTLARSRHPADLRMILERLSHYAGHPWTADSIHLMRSHPGAQVRYERLESWPLKEAGSKSVGPGRPR